MNQRVTQILGLLSAAQEGLSVRELQERLVPEVSQPTLSRDLQTLRSRGLVAVDGRARATRYHASSRSSVSELRSKRMHERVAARLVQDPDLLVDARERLAQLRTVNPHGGAYHDRWQTLMDDSLPRLLRFMTEDSELADAMRKESPFTVLVSPTDRRQVFESLRAH